MNKYAVQAMRLWEQLAPTALSEMEDPSRHFSTLGEEALEQVTSLALQLEGPDVPGETYFEKVGRIQNATLRAEEIVRADLLMPPPDVQDVTDDEIEDNLPADEVSDLIDQLRRGLRDLPGG